MTTENPSVYKDRTPILALIGGGLLLVGAVAAFLGPYEIYCFYLFSEGGRFHYEGFGFGTLMFASIAWQVVGYYAIALLCIPLGYGHVRPRRWARVLMLSLLWCASILGLPLIVVFLFMLSVKALSSTVGLLVVVALGLAYLTVPVLLIRFYKSHDVRQTFEARDARSYWIERLPIPVLVLAVLFIFYVIFMHVPLFFNGFFPLFGIWLFDVKGFLALDITIVSLVYLTWGVLRQRMWAWWGSLAYFGLLTVSAVVTLVRASFAEMLAPMQLPPTEMEMLKGVPLQGIHFVPFVGVPLLITLSVIVLSRRHFVR
ncbi:MAG: hypothetical protein JXR84_19305 [Anaerolineae bacterium]|nr:hypothetical protein [Anaerolineae bacterium]